MPYPLKNRIISWISQHLFDNVTYTVRNGLNKGLRRRGGLGWLPMDQSNHEIDFWKSLDLKNKVVYDIGAFHGLLTIFFAHQAKLVVAFEPTGRNRARLNQNVQLNSFSNVIVRPYGLSSKAMRAEMSFDPLTPGMASLDSRLAIGAQHENIELRTLDEEQGLEPPDLVKIDVEGFELEVLKGAVHTLERHPDLFLEMHGVDAEDKRRRVAAIAEFLWSIGYRNILHVESGTLITPENSAVAARGHLYARNAAA
ncbi:MAG TPA: FkbM family methyltransferase [Bryobacteraceae bacterium]